MLSVSRRQQDCEKLSSEFRVTVVRLSLAGLRVVIKYSSPIFISWYTSGFDFFHTIYFWLSWSILISYSWKNSYFKFAASSSVVRFIRQSRFLCLIQPSQKKGNSGSGVPIRSKEFRDKDDEKIQLREEDTRKMRDKLQGALPSKCTESISWKFVFAVFREFFDLCELRDKKKKHVAFTAVREVLNEICVASLFVMLLPKTRV